MGPPLLGGLLTETRPLSSGIEPSNPPLDPGFDSADDYGMFRLIAILLSSLWLSGCFILEELRQGDALIDQHSVGWREKKESMQQAEEEAAKAEAEIQQHRVRNAGPSVKDKLSDWWHETVDGEPVTANPNDKLVRCELRGTVHFLRKSDCQLRRGRTTELKRKPKSTGTARPKPGQGG
jgi:hypothetical protein